MPDTTGRISPRGRGRADRPDPDVPDRGRPRLHPVHAGAGRRGRSEARREVRGHRPRGRRGARREPARAPRRRGPLRLLVGPGGDPNRGRRAAAVRRGDPRTAGAAAHRRHRSGRRRSGRRPGRLPGRRAQPGRPPLRPGTRRRDPRVTRGHAPRTADRRRPLRGSRLADVQGHLGAGRGRSRRPRRRRSDGAAAAVRAPCAPAHEDGAAPGADRRDRRWSWHSSRSRSPCSGPGETPASRSGRTRWRG